MTPRERRDLWPAVMSRFPRLESEARCRMERETRNQARESYLKTLYNAINGQNANNNSLHQGRTH